VLNRATQAVKQRWAILAVLALLGGYWLLPISGQVVVIPEDRSAALPWPRITMSPVAVELGQTATIEVTDVAAWGHVRLTINGAPARLERWWQTPGGAWTWQWTVRLTEETTGSPARGLVVAFYRDCDTGCVQRGQMVIGGPSAPLPPPTPGFGAPTKLGVVFANPERDWHGRQGWDVELTYARLADSWAEADVRWGIDQLAARVHRARQQGLRVLVRVDFDRGQSLPPAGDELALSEYLGYLRRLARDDRLAEVYGYIIGTGFNAADSNQLAPDRSVTPAWYARLFNGAGEPVARADNAVQTIRAEHPQVRVLVGPVRPWVAEPAGEADAASPAPWLAYMDRLAATLDAGARAKAAAGIPGVAPDGFALHTPGRPELATALTGGSGAAEPRLSLTRPETGAAQLGFRVYQDYLAIINAYPTTRGRPAYITSTNTFAPGEGTPPAQNYPKGWLTTALQVINEEPQVAALCWFMDGPLEDEQWQWFRLSRPTGNTIDAATEFDALLRDGGASP
jgi:hypothetical protein